MAQTPAAKMILTFRRKPGLTLDQFIDYYETKHAPLILSFSQRVSVYRRNYVRHSFLTAHAEGGGTGGDPDVIVELHFATQADCDAFTNACTDNNETIVKDELNFVDRTTIRGYLVTESTSEL